MCAFGIYRSEDDSKKILWWAWQAGVASNR